MRTFEPSGKSSVYGLPVRVPTRVLWVEVFQGIAVRLTSDLQISCRQSSDRPHKSTLPLLGLKERGAHTEFRPAPACRLHLRARQRRRQGYDTSG